MGNWTIPQTSSCVVLLLLVVFRVCHAWPLDIPSTRISTHLLMAKQQVARRWNGNSESPSSSVQVASLRKSKKLKLDLQANGVTKTFEKKRMESIQHVLTKAILWKLFLNDYPNLQVEYDIGDADYLPDVVSLSETENSGVSKPAPVFWGESGRMRVHKAMDLLERYPNTHIVHCRWGMEIEQFRTPLVEAIQEQNEQFEDLVTCTAVSEVAYPNRTKPFTLCSLPFDLWKFIDEETGIIHITKEDLKWQDL